MDGDWDYLVPEVVLHLPLECVQGDVVLQLECLLGDLVLLVVPQLEHLLVGWTLEVVQLVLHEVDLEGDVGNLLLNLLSDLSDFLVDFLPLPAPLPLPLVDALCADFVLTFLA